MMSIRIAIRVNNKTLASNLWVSRSFAHQTGSKIEFPSGQNPSPYEILHLPTTASLDEIKERYFELVRQYHPDTAKTEDEGISQDVAEAKFHAITNAYQTLREKGGGTDRLGELSSAEYDAEAEAIRKRFAQWEENMARRPTLPNDLERRRRALEADGSISLWKSDKTLYYLLGGATLAVAILQLQSRRASERRDELKKYLNLGKKRANNATKDS